MKRVSGLNEVSSYFKAIALDQFGVIHDGIQVYENAIECITQLSQSHEIFLVSNTARLKRDTLQRLRDLGFPDPLNLFDEIITAGDVFFEFLETRSDLNRNITTFFPLAPPHLVELYKNYGLRFTNDFKSADILLSFGPYDLTVIDADILEFSCERGIEMICVNPELFKIHGSKVLAGAGLLAQQYENAGGRVNYIGKPSKLIFDKLLRCSHFKAHELLFVGDSLVDDIQGAAHHNIQTLLIGDLPIMENFNSTLVTPNFLMPTLKA